MKKIIFIFMCRYFSPLFNAFKTTYSFLNNIFSSLSHHLKTDHPSYLTGKKKSGTYPNNISSVNSYMPGEFSTFSASSSPKFVNQTIYIKFYKQPIGITIKNISLSSEYLGTLGNTADWIFDKIGVINPTVRLSFNFINTPSAQFFIKDKRA